MIFVSPDQQHVITTNVASGTVTLSDHVPAPAPPPPPPGMTPPPTPFNRPGMPGGQGGVRLDWNETTIKVGNGSEGFDVSPDGREIWVANAQDGTISIIDRASKTVVATLQANVEGANRLKFTLDGKHVLVSTLSGPDLVILNAATRDEFKRIPIGHGAAGILIEPNGARAFVACTPDNYLAVIDLTTFKVTAHIQSGDEPDGLAWASSNTPATN